MPLISFSFLMSYIGIEKEASEILTPFDAKPSDDDNEGETWKQDEEEDKVGDTDQNNHNTLEEGKEDNDIKKVTKKNNKVHTESMTKNNNHYRDATMGKLDQYCPSNMIKIPNAYFR